MLVHFLTIYLNLMKVVFCFLFYKPAKHRLLLKSDNFKEIKSCFAQRGFDYFIKTLNWEFNEMIFNPIHFSKPLVPLWSNSGSITDWTWTYMPLIARNWEKIYGEIEINEIFNGNELITQLIYQSAFVS